VDRRKNLAFAVVALLAAASAHPICNLLFRCGCGWFTAAACNVHHATGPHCPWCTTRWAFPVVIASWLAGAAIAMRIFGLKGLVIGMVIAVLGSGAITVAVSGYPRFLWW
jgi:hypothetical protein